MTNSPRSPKLLKGAIVAVNPGNPHGVLANPQSLVRGEAGGELYLSQIKAETRIGS
jgi:hypothetical protein